METIFKFTSGRKFAIAVTISNTLCGALLLWGNNWLAAMWCARNLQTITKKKEGVCQHPTMQ